MEATDITANVVESLRQGTQDLEAFIRQYLAGNGKELAVLEEASALSWTNAFQEFQKRERLYLSFLIQKSAAPTCATSSVCQADKPSLSGT